MKVDGRAVHDVADAERLVTAGATPGTSTLLVTFARRSSIMATLGDAVWPTAAAHLEFTLNNLAWWAFAQHVTILVQPIGSTAVRAVVVLLVALIINVISVSIFIANRVAWVLQAHRLEEAENQDGPAADFESAAAEQAPATEPRAGHSPIHIENDAAGPMLHGLAASVMVPSHRRPCKAKPHPATAFHVQELRCALNSWVHDASPEDVQLFYQKISVLASSRAEEAAKCCPIPNGQNSTESRAPLLIGEYVANQSQGISA